MRIECANYIRSPSHIWIKLKLKTTSADSTVPTYIQWLNVKAEQQLFPRRCSVRCERAHAKHTRRARVGPVTFLACLAVFLESSVFVVVFFTLLFYQRWRNRSDSAQLTGSRSLRVNRTEKHSKAVDILFTVNQGHSTRPSAIDESC